MKKLLFKSALYCTLFISSISCMQDSSEKFQNGRLVKANNTSTVQRLIKTASILGFFVLPITYVITNPLMRDWHCNEPDQDWNSRCNAFMDVTTIFAIALPLIGHAKILKQSQVITNENRSLQTDDENIYNNTL